MALAKVIGLDATPERKRLADNDNVVELGVRRFLDHPLASLHAREALDESAEMNEILYVAGVRYASDVNAARLDGAIRSPDYASPIVDGGRGGSAAERVAGAVDRVRRAWACLGPRYRAVVDAVVIEERSDLVTVGREFGSARHERAARALAVERLSAGLFLLARHYGLCR
jgi:hypothetical protein